MAEQTDDPFLDAVAEHWEKIVAGYKQFEDKRPVVLYDIQEERVYLYPYEDFKNDMSPTIPGVAGRTIRTRGEVGPDGHVRPRQRGREARFLHIGLQVRQMSPVDHRLGRARSCQVTTGEAFNEHAPGPEDDDKYEKAFK